MNILIPQGEDDYVSDRTYLINGLSVLGKCTETVLLFCFTERVSRSRAVQDSLGWLQTGDRTY